MDSDRPRLPRRQGYRQPLDRRVDKWIETGRQVVDGVAGNRPGMRRVNASRVASTGFEKVGRWMGEKLDWFLEEEDGWLEPWQANTHAAYATSKKPLDAISLRSQNLSNSSSNHSEDEWPEDSSFRVDRWQRNDQDNENLNSERPASKRRDLIRSARRPLPRSSRRRI